MCDAGAGVLYNSAKSNYKGAGLAMMVDILSAGLTRSNYSYRVSSFGSCEGGPTQCGQLVVAFNPQLLGGAQFSAGLEAMLLAMQETPAVRLPGDRRLLSRAHHAKSITVPSDIVALLTRYGEQGSPSARP